MGTRSIVLLVEYFYIVYMCLLYMMMVDFGVLLSSPAGERGKTD